MSETDHLILSVEAANNNNNIINNNNNYNSNNNNNDHNNNRCQSLDDLLEYVSGDGLDLRGRYTLWLTCACGLANASDAVEIVAVSFIVSSVKDEFDITGFQEGLLTSVIFLGMMIGGWLWGSLSDTLGRCRVLSMCLLVNAFFGFVSAFCPEYYSLLVCRFLSGLGVGGSIPVIFTYYSEFLPPSSRGSLISLMAISWPVGTLFVSLVAWATLPFEITIGTINNAAWRVFLIPCSLPALCGSIIFWRVADESVKWLYYERRDDVRAYDVLNKIAHAHARPLENVAPLFGPATLSEFYDMEMAQTEEGAVKAENKSGLCDVMESVMTKTRALFTRRQTTLILIQAAIWFSLSFAFYGCYEFLPTYFESINNGTDTDVSPYLSSVITSLAQFPGVLLTAYLLQHPELHIDRAKILAVSLLASCVCLLLGGVVPIDSGMGEVAFMSAFAGASVLAWTILDVITPELAPTDVRSTAYGVLCAVGRVGAIAGNLLFGLFSNQFIIPMVVSSMFLLGGAVLGLLLPSMKGKPIH